MKDLKIQQDLESALEKMDAVILAVRHSPYLDLDPEDLVKWAGAPLAVIDGFAILSDENIKRFLELGCEVRGLGRGHISRIKEELEG